MSLDTSCTRVCSTRQGKSRFEHVKNKRMETMKEKMKNSLSSSFSSSSYACSECLSNFETIFFSRLQTFDTNNNVRQMKRKALFVTNSAFTSKCVEASGKFRLKSDKNKDHHTMSNGSNYLFSFNSTHLSFGEIVLFDRNLSHLAKLSSIWCTVSLYFISLRCIADHFHIIFLCKILFSAQQLSHFNWNEFGCSDINCGRWT